MGDGSNAKPPTNTNTTKGLYVCSIKNEVGGDPCINPGGGPHQVAHLLRRTLSHAIRVKMTL